MSNLADFVDVTRLRDKHLELRTELDALGPEISARIHRRNELRAQLEDIEGLIARAQGRDPKHTIRDDLAAQAEQLRGVKQRTEADLEHVEALLEQLDPQSPVEPADPDPPPVLPR